MNLIDIKYRLKHSKNITMSCNSQHRIIPQKLFYERCNVRTFFPYGNQETIDTLEGLITDENKVGAGGFGQTHIVSYRGETYVIKKQEINCNNPTNRVIQLQCELRRQKDPIYQIPNTLTGKTTFLMPTYLSEPLIADYIYKLKQYTPCFPLQYSFHFNFKEVGATGGSSIYTVMERLDKLRSITRSGINYLIFQLSYSIHVAQSLLRFTHYDLHLGNVMRRPRDKKVHIYPFNGKYVYTLFDYDNIIIDYGMSRLETKNEVICGKYNFSSGRIPGLTLECQNVNWIGWGVFDPFYDLYSMLMSTGNVVDATEKPYIEGMVQMFFKGNLQNFENVGVGPQQQYWHRPCYNKLHQDKCLHVHEFLSQFLFKYVPYVNDYDSLEQKLKENGMVVSNNLYHLPYYSSKYRNKYLHGYAIKGDLNIRQNFHDTLQSAKDECTKLDIRCSGVTYDNNIHRYTTRSGSQLLDSNGNECSWKKIKPHIFSSFPSEKIPFYLPVYIHNINNIVDNRIDDSGFIIKSYRGNLTDGNFYMCHVAQINQNRLSSNMLGWRFRFDCCYLSSNEYFQSDKFRSGVMINGGFFNFDNYHPLGTYKSSKLSLRNKIPEHYRDYYGMVILKNNRISIRNCDEGVLNQNKQVFCAGPLLLNASRNYIFDDNEVDTQIQLDNERKKIMMLLRLIYAGFENLKVKYRDLCNNIVNAKCKQDFQNLLLTNGKYKTIYTKFIKPYHRYFKGELGYIELCSIPIFYLIQGLRLDINRIEIDELYNKTLEYVEKKENISSQLIHNLHNEFFLYPFKSRGPRNWFEKNCIPRFFKDGFFNHTVISPGELSHAGNRNPRTVIATKGDYLYFIYVEGRRTRSNNGREVNIPGMTMVELADFCRTRLECDWSLNLDGGTSSNLNWKLPNDDRIYTADENASKTYRVGNILAYVLEK